MFYMPGDIVDQHMIVVPINRWQHPSIYQVSMWHNIWYNHLLVGPTAHTCLIALSSPCSPFGSGATRLPER